MSFTVGLPPKVTKVSPQLFCSFPFSFFILTIKFVSMMIFNSHIPNIALEQMS